MMTNRRNKTRAAGVLLALLLAVALPLAAAASVVSPSEDFYVLDEANVLTEATKATIVYNNDALYEACGAQIVIVTVDSTGTMQISDYAYKLFNDWGIGSSDRNNGVLILLEIGAEDYWYVQGSGLERNLSTADLSVMVDTYLEPDFAVGDYDAGVSALFEQLFMKVAGIYGASVTYREYSGATTSAGGGASPKATTAPAATRAPSVPTATGGGTERSGGTTQRRSVLGTIVRLVIGVWLLSVIVGFFRRRRDRRLGLPVLGLGVLLLRPWRVFTRRRTTVPPRQPDPVVPPTQQFTAPGGPASAARRAGQYAGMFTGAMRGTRPSRPTDTHAASTTRPAPKSNTSSGSIFSKGGTASGGGRSTPGSSYSKGNSTFGGSFSKGNSSSGSGRSSFGSSFSSGRSSSGGGRSSFSGSSRSSSGGRSSFGGGRSGGGGASRGGGGGRSR